jgi:hypothetical protein
MAERPKNVEPVDENEDFSGGEPPRKVDGSTIAKRITVNLRQGDNERLERIVRDTHLPPNDVIRRALATESFIIRNLREGRKILVQDTDGTLREVEFLY